MTLDEIIELRNWRDMNNISQSIAEAAELRTAKFRAEMEAERLKKENESMRSILEEVAHDQAARNVISTIAVVMDWKRNSK